jgi:quinol monooxygenase YgiN
MAIGVLFDAAGMSKAQYDQVRNRVAPGDQPPAGLLYHAGGTTEDGGVCVIEVWESQEALQRVFEETLGPALQDANVGTQPRMFQGTTIMQSEADRSRH